MMAAVSFDRIALVVHPSRDLRRALATVEAWAAEQRAELVQLDVPGQEQEVAPEGDPGDCDLVVALGGDGTTLAALHAAAPASRPVLGVACGSLGALTAVTADRLEDALGRVAAGDWAPRRLPGLAVEHPGGRITAVNDLVLVRAGAGQVAIELVVDGERYVRYAGDGLVAATPLGSTAYTLAAGGPMLAPGTTGLVLTPLAPHGGVCPPIVTSPETRVAVTLNPGHGGARLEADGRIEGELSRMEDVTLELSFLAEHATLVSLGEHEPLLAGLRRRRIILDSPRVLARDEREAAAAARANA
jgi:NAD+ kinase